MSGQTTVLITDIEGSTAFTEGRGDERAMELLRRHERLVRGVVAACGGREIKSMGDGFMIAFADARVGVDCALAIANALDEHNREHADEPIRVRMGLNVGTVIEEGGDIYGTTVNATARIASKARSGQILVSDEVRFAAGEGAFDFVDRGLFWLKGLRERWRLFEVVPEGAVAAPAAVPEGRTPFVGREAERADLRARVDAAVDGRGGFVLLTGDAGAGKTRLAEEIGSEAAARGMSFLVARCYEATRSHPFAPISDVLESVQRQRTSDEFRMLLGETAGEIARILPQLRTRFPDIPPPTELPPEQERRYLFLSLREMLTALAIQRPVMLLIDDLHWADDPSLLFLEHLAGELSGIPLLIVATYPVSGLESSLPLQSLVERLDRQRTAERITLGPIAIDDAAVILGSLAGSAPPDEIVEFLHRETEGNALFFEEVARHLLTHERLVDRDARWTSVGRGFELEVPETIRLTIGRRLDVLMPSTRRILTTAAIVGRGFGFDLLDDLADATEDDLLDALDDAERARVITSATEHGAIRFRFVHELIRQTLIADVSLTRRQLLHLRVADAIERVYADELESYVTALAYHLVEAGRRADVSRTLSILEQAGTQAQQAAAYEEALRYEDRALSLVDIEDLPARAPILERIAANHRSLGHPDDAIAAWNEALDAYEALGERDAVARLCLDAGIQVSWWTAHPGTMVLIDRGLSAVGERNTPTKAGLLALSGVISSHVVAYADAESKLGEALELARELGDERILGMVLYTKTAHHFNYQEHADAVRFGREAIELLERAGDLWNLCNVQGFVGQSLGFLGRFDEAAEQTAGMKQLAERLGNWVAYVYIDRARAWRYMCRTPDADVLEADGRRDVELGRRLGFRWMFSLGYTRMSLAAYIRGHWEESLQHAIDSAGYERGVGEGHLGRLVLLHAYLGNADEAIEAFERLRRRFPSIAEPSYVGAWDSFLAGLEGMAVLGERERVAELYDLAVMAARMGTLFRGWDYRLFTTLAAIAAACRERYDEAEEWIRASIATADSLPFVLEQPESRRFHAWILLRRREPGDVDRARELLADAASRYHALGMSGHERLTREMLTGTA